MLQNVHGLLRTLLLLALVAIGGWWTLFLRGKLSDHQAELAERQETIEVLEERVEERDQRLEELGVNLRAREAEVRELSTDLAEAEETIRAQEVALQLLKVDHRIARIEVLAQGASAEDPDRVRTTLLFTELGPDGEPIGEGVEATVDGKTVYVETLIVKFDDEFVEKGDALRGTAICLFRRLFGEEQKPSEGVPLDPVGLQPLAYTGDEGPDALYIELWDRFWDYANDKELAESLGVRAIQGEAPFIETRPGKTYRVELRSSGGLTIQPE